MLQQTTVAAVVPYYERFLARFPTVQALARASEHDVLRLWEGLGYYSRARNLRRAAQQIVSEWNGTIPHDLADLVRLPGIGRYTAGAIASLAYDRPAPIVEANTLRVYARLLAFGGDVHSTGGRNVIWNFAERAVPRRSAGVFNQALMDLGATICTPAEPACERCPVRSCCRAFRDGVVHEIPRPRVRPQTTFVDEAMVAVRRGRALSAAAKSCRESAGPACGSSCGSDSERTTRINGNGSRTKTQSRRAAFDINAAATGAGRGRAMRFDRRQPAGRV